MQLDAERCAVMSLLTKKLNRNSQGRWWRHPHPFRASWNRKTYSIRSYLQPRVKQEGIEFCLLNCYAARTEVLTLQPRPQTVYVIDELDSLFAFTDQRTVDSLSPLKVLALSNPVLGLINDFTVELQSRISVFFGSSIKPHIHSFPAPSINELIAISQALFLDAELVADKATLTFLASQIVKHRHGDIRILVRTVQNLRVLAGTATKVGLKDVHEALNQALQRYKSHGMALELSEMEAKVLSVILDHCRESNGTISLLEIRRGYKVAMGVDIDIPEASIMTTLEILLSKGVIVDATRTNVQLEKSRLSHKRMKTRLPRLAFTSLIASTVLGTIPRSYGMHARRHWLALIRRHSLLN